MTDQTISIIGAGLAGSEAAWQLAKRGVKVKLYEMRYKNNLTPAHQTDTCAELVCSNSFRNDDVTSAIGLLHEEMRRSKSLIMQAADFNKVPAGSSLAMDREAFATYVEEALISHPNIELIRASVDKLPSAEAGLCIVATGPLTSEKLSHEIIHITGQEHLAFFDAIAPIIYTESIDFNKAWYQSRYDKIGPMGSGKDYINCPMTADEYYAFIEALLSAEKMSFKEWEKNTPYFNACLPIEVMAERGKDTLLFGPMKPVGLTNPKTNTRAYAVVQLRQDNSLGSLYNIVGFQTKLKHPAQKEVFRMIPGLENAEFARLGGLHRNTFINSPSVLDSTLRVKENPYLTFAGQITGVEGYVESAAIGLLAGIFNYQTMTGKTHTPPPPSTALGSLLRHITINANSQTFQPMNINYGLFEASASVGLKKEKKIDRYSRYTAQALKNLDLWLKDII